MVGTRRSTSEYAGRVGGRYPRGAAAQGERGRSQKTSRQRPEGDTQHRYQAGRRWHTHTHKHAHPPTHRRFEERDKERNTHRQNRQPHSQISHRRGNTTATPHTFHYTHRRGDGGSGTLYTIYTRTHPPPGSAMELQGRQVWIVFPLKPPPPPPPNPPPAARPRPGWAGQSGRRPAASVSRHSRSGHRRLLELPCQEDHQAVQAPSALCARRHLAHAAG